MSQNSFIPTGSETHLDARAVWNGNAADAESRLTALESGSAGAVDSVNTQTGVVVLDADDIDDSATTNKFATQAELDKANSALQPTEPTLESVTTNGATTKNNIQVGTIATLHPTAAANDNAATGLQSASIGGRRNVASGTRATTFGGLSNTVIGQDSTVVGGNNQRVIGVESEGVGSTNLKLFSKYTSAVGAANSTIGTLNGVEPNPENLYANDSAAKHSIILGGEDIEIQHAEHAATVGGNANTVETNHHRSVILGGANIITDASDTAYVQNLNVKSAVKIPTGAVDTYVLTSDANGVGTWQAKEIVTPQVVLENGVQILVWDHALGSTIKHTLTDDVFSIDISNVVDGDSGLIILRQDGNGPWTYQGSGFVGGGPVSQRILAGDLASIATVLTSEVITLGWFYDGQANLIYYYVSEID